MFFPPQKGEKPRTQGIAPTPSLLIAPICSVIHTPKGGGELNDP
jgi:hypothetical protein